MDPAGSADTASMWAGYGLTITVTVDHDLRARVRVSGALTAAGADLLRDCLDTQLRAGGRHAGVDLFAVDEADDAGLAALLEAHRSFRACRGTLIVSSVSPPLRRLISTSGADGELLIDARADLPPLTSA